MAKVPGPEEWLPLPIDKGLFRNLAQDAVLQYSTALENAFVNELGGISRFPGLQLFATLYDNGSVYLSDFQGTLIAATSNGAIYRVSKTGQVTQMGGAPISGGSRVIMAPTNQEVLFAAGGPIVRLRQNAAELLGGGSPNASYVAWIDGIAIANQIGSYNWYYSNAGDISTWPALNIFSADSNPDNINTILIDPFREILIGGTNKIEQWERYTSGSIPFFRRWAMGDGMKLPYGSVFADNAIFTINGRNEFVRFINQTSINVGAEIGVVLEKVDDWTYAWIGGYPSNPLNIVGQKFILIQAPNATNEYGTKGITICYDYRNKKFCFLYGWDNARGVPTRWPGWSHWMLWDQVFVGGQGVIYRLTTDTWWNNTTLSRWLVRTAHVAQGNMVQIKNFRLRLKRGVGGPAQPAPQIRVRCRRDAGPFGAWVTRDLGIAGDNIQFLTFGSFGTATTFMFEIMCADNVPVDLIAVEVKAAPIGH